MRMLEYKTLQYKTYLPCHIIMQNSCTQLIYMGLTSKIFFSQSKSVAKVGKKFDMKTLIMPNTGINKKLIIST
jgi:hypothetical protein